jgi:hypothetical protein
MKIRLLKALGVYRRGEVVDLPESTARQMIAAGNAVEDRQQSLIETASVDLRVERADLTPRKMP